MTETGWGKSFKTHHDPAHTLPPELVSEIFLDLLPTYPECPPNFGVHSPLVLCQVSSQWRAIAISTPTLWRAILVNVTSKDSDEKLTARLELMQSWLSRSGDLPVSLSLDNTFPKKSPFAGRFLKAALQHSRRWEYVKLSVRREHMHLIQVETPLLRELSFSPLRRGRREEPLAWNLFNRAPQLRKITIPRRFCLRASICLPWGQLTHLDLRAHFDNECMEILSEAPHLIHCRLCVGYSNLPLRAVVHPRLRHLTLFDCDSYVRLRNFLDHLTLPVLCALRIYARGIPLSTFEALIARSGCILEDLRL
ncbi:hypothetical protein C8R47DRAFT_1026603, partial [Mycena vitilis]